MTENAKAGMTIEKIVSKIDTDRMRKNLIKNYAFEGVISGTCWSDVIDAIRSSDIQYISGYEFIEGTQGEAFGST